MATAIERMVTPVLRAAIGLALPPRCPGCGAIVDGDHRFCAPCWAGLEFLGPSACARCAVPLDHGDLCEACHAAPRAFARARAAVAYGETARAVALRLKYGRRPGMARTMAAAMARLLADAPPQALLVPVPLHRWRLWSRGYNQAQAIAAALARTSGLRHEPGLLLRTRSTPVLRGLGREARARAVRDAFAVARAERIAGRAVILIDDVMTTGATADACARACLAAGAAEVWLLCWARVVKGDGG
jgi:ComF family protein